MPTINGGKKALFEVSNLGLDEAAQTARFRRCASPGGVVAAGFGLAFGSDDADFGKVVSEATVVLGCCTDGRCGCGGGQFREQIVNDLRQLEYACGILGVCC